MTNQLTLYAPDDRTGAYASGPYRYLLWRKWSTSKYARILLFIMLNPSTADADHDDPTIRRCLGFAKSWGYGGITVANLFAFRATDPKELDAALLQGVDIVGRMNDVCLRGLARAHNVEPVFAWGCFKQYRERMLEVIKLFPDAMAISVSKDGYPNHPLYLPAHLKPIKFEPWN